MSIRRRLHATAIAAALGGVALAAATAGSARADDELVCDERHGLDAFQLVRRLSLDLAGTAPSLEHLERVAAADGDEAQTEAVIAEITEELVASDGFRLATRRLHEAMLWPNVQNVRLGDIRVTLRYDDNDILQIAAANRRNLYRGDPDGNCGNFRHTSFDPDFPGQFRPLPQNGGKFGWREVSPYWDPSTPIKVCAHEAQQVGQAGGERCGTREGTYVKACGCGEGLRFCYRPVSENGIRDSLREQILRAVDAATAEGADYTDLVLGTRAMQDGRIAHWKRHLATNSAINKTWNDPDPDEQVLGTAYADGTWTEVERGPEHAGVLTMPGFLLKFQTGRGRVNRFRQAFQCQSFEPPATTEDAATDGCSETANDLTERCTCRYCHVALEPLAIGFERFAEAGTTVLSPDAGFPPFDASCKGSNDPFCRRFYVNGNGARGGWLRPLELAAKHDEYTERFEQGPRRIVAEAIWEDGDPSRPARTGAGSFAGCAARRAFVHFIRRTPNEAEEATIDALAAQMGDGFDYRALVRAVVSNDAYRRIR